MRKHISEIGYYTAKLGATIAAELLFWCPLQGAEPHDSVRQLDDIEVVASQRNDMLTSAIPKFSIDADAMRSAGITDLSDALRRLPGISLSDYGGDSGMKTISVRGLGTQHTGIILDGFMLGDAQKGSIDLSRFSLEALDQLSVNLGDHQEIFLPARAATAASTLSLVSESAPDFASAFRMNALIRTAAFGTYNPYLRIGTGNNRNFSLTATGEYLSSRNDYPYTIRNGQHTEHARRKNSNVSQGHADISTTIRTGIGTLSAKAYYYDADKHLPGPVIYYNPDSNERLRERNAFIQASLRSRLSALFSLLVNARGNYDYTHYTNRSNIYPGGLLDRLYRQNEAYGAATLLLTPGIPGLSAVYGADYVYNNLSSNLPTYTQTGSSEALNLHPYRHSVLQQLAAKYSNRRIDISARLLYSLYYTSSDEPDGATDRVSRLSPSVSVSYTPSDEIPLHIRASYRNIFRLPTFNELYFEHYGTINLKPEVADLCNIGITYEYDRLSALTITASADGYINLVTNKIVAIPYNMFMYTMTNYGRLNIYGLDATLSISYSLHRYGTLDLQGNYSLQRAEIRTSPDRSDWLKQAAYIPIHSGAASIGWRNPWVDITAHVTAAGRRYAVASNLPSSELEAYADLGITLSHRFSFYSHSLDIRADALNLLGQNYQLIARYPMPGRSWQVSLSFIW